jgi:hypothetical protein
MKSTSTGNPFDFFDRIFCVNLDSRPDRWFESLVEFEKVGLKDKVERLSGVELDTNHAMKGRAGVTSSFRKIWQEVEYENERLSVATMHDLKSENVLIFEDDVVFTKDAVDILSKSVSDLSTVDWDMFYLGVSVDAGRSHESPPFERITDSLLKCRNCQCLHAVAYNVKILPHLLKMVPDKNFILNWLAHNKSIDWWIMENIQEEYNVFCTDPMIATQRPSFSNIDNNQADWGQNLIDTFNKFVPLKNE